MSLGTLFHFLCAQHVSDINISIIRSLRLCCWITTLVVLFLVRCVLEIWCGWVGVVSVLQAASSLQHVVIQQNNRKLVMMDILMSATCWAHKKWNKIASDIKLVFDSSTITMMHGSINISDTSLILYADVHDSHNDDPHYLNASQLAWGHFAKPVSCSACRVTLQINEWHRVEQIPLTAEAKTRLHEGVTYSCNIIVTLRDIWETSLPLACLIDLWHCQLQVV